MEKEYKDFCKKLQMELKKRFSEKRYTVDLHSVMKNNSVKYDGLVIYSSDDEISPNFYLQALFAHYMQGTSLTELAIQIEEKYFETKKKKTNLNMDFSFEKCQDRIVFRLVSYEKNRELLKTIPYISYLDMAILFYVVVGQNEDGVSSFCVSCALMEKWDVDVEILMQKAAMNSKRLFPLKLHNMYEMMLELIQSKGLKNDVEDYLLKDIFRETEDVPVVITNMSGIHGASVILYEGCLQAVSDMFQGDYYLLPSSVHEFLAVSYSEAVKQKDLKDMVHEVNQACVSEDEILSNSVYFYDSKKEQLEICI